MMTHWLAEGHYGIAVEVGVTIDQKTIMVRSVSSSDPMWKDIEQSSTGKNLVLNVYDGTEIMIFCSLPISTRLFVSFFIQSIIE